MPVTGNGDLLSKVFELASKIIERDNEIEALNAKILELKNEILDLAVSSECKKSEDAPVE